jgi:hypothetical protein
MREILATIASVDFSRKDQVEYLNLCSEERLRQGFTTEIPELDAMIANLLCEMSGDGRYGSTSWIESMWSRVYERQRPRNEDAASEMSGDEYGDTSASSEEDQEPYTSDTDFPPAAEIETSMENHEDFQSQGSSLGGMGDADLEYNVEAELDCTFNLSSLT